MSMTTTRITVSLPSELAAFIKSQVESGAYDSVSAYMAHAAETLRHVDPLELLIASMVAESGEPGPEAEAWADNVVAVARRTQAKRRRATSA